MSIEAVTPAADAPEATPSLMDAPEAQVPEAAADKPDDKPAEPTAEEQAAAEETRRAALSDDERAAEDAAKLTDEQKAEAEAEGAPEEYDDFETPDGVELNADMLAEFKTFAKEHNLSQAAAQTQIDMGVKLMQGWTDSAVKAFTDRAAEWREQSTNDAEFGGTKLAENMPIAVKAREQFGTPELKALLDEYRLGDHPEVIRFFYRVGKATKEDSFVQSGKAGEASTANKIFNHPSNRKAG